MTLAQIRTAIQQRGYATDTATAQTELVNSVYRRVISMRRWPFLEVDNDTSITTTVGDGTYALSGITDLLHVDAVRIEVGTEFIEPDYRSRQEFRTLEHSYRENGTPRYWTNINQVLHLWPRPDRVYTVSVDYVKDPPDLSADGDTPVLPAAYHDILTWGAVAELCFRERDVDGLSMAKDEYGSRLVDMMNQYGVRQRQTSGEVVRSNTMTYLDQDNLLLWPT